MKKKIIFFCILLILSSSVLAFLNGLSILDVSDLENIELKINLTNKEEVFCLQDGNCNVSNMIVYGNLSVFGTFVNITVTKVYINATEIIGINTTIEALGNNTYLRLDTKNDPLTNDLDVGDNEINNASNITVNNRLNFGNPNLYITNIHPPNLDITNETLGFHNDNILPEGGSPYCFFAKTFLGRDIVVVCFQNGKNGSGAYIRNSGGVFPDLNLSNASILTNTVEMWNRFGIQPIGSYFSSINETGWAALFSLESQQLYLHNDLGNGLLLGEGKFTWIGGETADFVNTSIHPQLPVTFVSGFNKSQEVPLVSEPFSFGLGIFSNQQDDSGNWQIVNDAGKCDDDTCARASGVGSGNIIMRTNFNTLDVNNTQLSLVYSLVGLVGGSTFDIEIDNGSGFTSLLSASGTTTQTSFSTELDEGFWDRSSINLTIACNVQANKPLRLCFVDTVKINGTAIIDTTANQTGIKSQYCGGDGIIQANGECNRALIYDPVTDTWIFKGIVNFTGTVTGGAVSGTGTPNKIPKWSGITSLTDSNIFDDGTNIGIGTVNPTSVFQISADTPTAAISQFLVTDSVGVKLFRVRKADLDTTGVVEINNSNFIIRNNTNGIALQVDADEISLFTEVGLGATMTATGTTKINFGDAQQFIHAGKVGVGGNIGIGFAEDGQIFIQAVEQSFDRITKNVTIFTNSSVNISANLVVTDDVTVGGTFFLNTTATNMSCTPTCCSWNVPGLTHSFGC